MLINKAVYIYLCVRSVSCLIDSLNDEDYEDDTDSDDSEDISENEIAVPVIENLNNEGIDFTHQGHMRMEEINVNSAKSRYPFVASIHRKGPHYANGALVHKRWVISSAGEFYNVQESIKLFHVRLGTVNCKRGGTTSKIKAVQVHPSFEPGNPHFDLSLLLLAVPMTVSHNIRPVHFSDNILNIVSAEFISAYWPRIIVNGELLPAHAKERTQPYILRVSTQLVVEFADCASKVQGLQNTSFCLAPLKDFHSKCSPDAGAPIVAADGLWGVTSGWKSKQCKLQPSPTVVTRVSPASVKRWIDSQMFT